MPLLGERPYNQTQHVGALPCALAVSLLLLKSLLSHGFEERLQFRITHATGFDLGTKWRENLIERP